MRHRRALLLPLSFHGEHLRSEVRERDGQLSDSGGVYASASRLLSGETRPYDRTETSSRIEPNAALLDIHGESLEPMRRSLS